MFLFKALCLCVFNLTCLPSYTFGSFADGLDNGCLCLCACFKANKKHLHVKSDNLNPSRSVAADSLLVSPVRWWRSFPASRRERCAHLQSPRCQHTAQSDVWNVFTGNHCASRVHSPVFVSSYFFKMIYF